jgi:carbon-monoxide dehydrogenase medium subunit
MQGLRYEAPTTLDAAVALLAGGPAGSRVIAGGTDVIVQMETDLIEPPLLVDIKKIAELKQITQENGGFRVGAAAPGMEIVRHAAFCKAWPGIVDGVKLIGSIQIKGRASIGGNLCNAAPSADAVPLLIALRTTCRVAGPAGEREIAVENFCSGPGRNVLHPGELLVSLHIPPPEPHSGACYLRFIPRNEMDIAVAGAGVSVTLDNGAFRSARIALSSVAPTPLYVQDAGEWLTGKPVDAEGIRGAAEMAKAAAKPITDMRGTAAYRKHLCAVLTRRALESAIAKAREAR